MALKIRTPNNLEADLREIASITGKPVYDLSIDVLNEFVAKTMGDLEYLKLRNAKREADAAKWFSGTEVHLEAVQYVEPIKE